MPAIRSRTRDKQCELLCGHVISCKDSNGQAPPSFSIISALPADVNAWQVSDQLWIFDDDARSGDVCMVAGCLRDKQVWLSKADGSKVSGPYEIGGSSPTSGNEPHSHRSLYLIELRSVAKSAGGTGYFVGDKLYFNVPWQAVVNSSGSNASHTEQNA
eukprot:TRINITY_DN8647_c0_g1_i1.p1 TRINITY_DN8647_c0_g1~~TRINITY_DN8647_c0_g1_i1.p1  ORF type:complete len:158 (+),score=17.24 TRINITY_DN8647_c0_g1_i1:259-732(+)